MRVAKARADVRKAEAARQRFIMANLRLVVSIAKRHVGPTENFFELVSDGNVSLIRAVEKFDFSRGNRFSTYASWAIMKNFARTIPDEHRYRDRFRTSQAEMFTSAEDDRTLVVRLSSPAALRGYLLIVLAAYVAIVAGVIAGVTPAATLLGLSDQVPARVEFLTDGTSRTVKAGPMQIVTSACRTTACSSSPSA